MATFRATDKASPKATHVEVAGVDAAVLLMKAGKIDCIALSRESLTGLLSEIPGTYIIDGGFLNSTTAIAVRAATKLTIGCRSGFPMSQPPNRLSQSQLSQMSHA